MHKKAAKKSHGAKHASQRHHERSAAQRDSTSTMGAGPATDLNAHNRQQRMDAAYANWQARR
jgi:hypothetical protein